MKLPIALQLYSVRDFMEKDLKATLKKVKGLGYDGVEFAGLYSHKPAEIKTILKELGLAAVSAHVPLKDLLADTTQCLSDYKEIGCHYVAVPWLEENRRPGHPGFEQTLKDIKAIGAEASALGMVLMYHNHDFEFVKVEGEYALDLLYKTVPAEYLQTEIDTCWVNVGGENPAGYIRKYTGRAPVVHLKDFVGQKSENMYGLIGTAKTGDEKAKGEFEFRPVGHGLQNFPEILKASEEAGAKWVVVEQDRPSMDKTSMECAELSIQYLKNLK